MKKRSYQQSRRAAATEETRRRITEAAMDLHRTIGPRLTTVAEIARKAGVERLTVYNHFPDEAALVEACQGHWLGLHPPPDPEAWRAISDPRERLRTALREVYRFYADTAPMTENVLRDGPAIASFAGVLEGMRQAAARSVELLSAGYPTRGLTGSVRLKATLAAALDFHTCDKLVRQSGMKAESAIELIVDWVDAARMSSPRDNASRIG